MDEVLGIRLAALGGVIGSPDLHHAGVSERAVRTPLRQGELTRVRRGAYVDAAVYREAGHQARYRMRVAAVLRTRRRDAASHHAAVAVHGLPLYGCDLRRIDTEGLVRGITVEGALVVHPKTPCSVETVDGVPAVPVAHAVVLATAGSGLRTGVVAADAALYSGKCRLDTLYEAVAGLSTQASSPRLAALVDLVDPTAESPGESLTRVILRMAGLPVRSQVRIGDAHGTIFARVDLLVAGAVVVEFDGEIKYAGDARDALFREKQREDRLRELGYEVVRVVWADLGDPARLIASACRRPWPGPPAGPPESNVPGVLHVTQ